MVEVTSCSTPRVIALTGHAGSGKDAVARILSRLGGYYRLGLMDMPKRHLLEAYGWMGLTPRQLWGSRKDRSESLLPSAQHCPNCDADITDDPIQCPVCHLPRAYEIPCTQRTPAALTHWIGTQAYRAMHCLTLPAYTAFRISELCAGHGDPEARHYSMIPLVDNWHVFGGDSRFLFVISGLRRLNEQGFLRSTFPKFETWHIVGRSEDVGGIKNHASESEIDLLTALHIIENTGSLDALAAKVEVLV